jgi:tripartite-type tricarboxylate transporter receptor subunit TctC
MKKIKWFIVGIAVIFFPIFSAQPLMAQTYPSQPIQLVITLAPGDSGDLTGRAIAMELSKILRTPVMPVTKRVTLYWFDFFEYFWYRFLV